MVSDSLRKIAMVSNYGTIITILIYSIIRFDAIVSDPFDLALISITLIASIGAGIISFGTKWPPRQPTPNPTGEYLQIVSFLSITLYTILNIPSFQETVLEDTLQLLGTIFAIISGLISFGTKWPPQPPKPDPTDEIEK